MIKGDDLLLDLEGQMNTIKLPLMALKLDELYRSPGYLHMDKLDFLSALIAPEFKDKVTKTINNRLRTAHIIGTPCEISSCKDSRIRQYEPHGVPKRLATLSFIEEGQNVCILGASDSGKTYLAKALGASACEKYRVSYNRCSELLESLVALKNENYGLGYKSTTSTERVYGMTESNTEVNSCFFTSYSRKTVMEDAAETLSIAATFSAKVTPLEVDTALRRKVILLSEAFQREYETLSPFITGKVLFCDRRLG